MEVTRSRWKDEALARGVTYEVGVEPAPLPPVAADPSELREVLINLVLKLRRRETMVVLVTGWSDQIDSVEAPWRGVDFVVGKPFEVEEIRSVLGQALARVPEPSVGSQP